MSATETLVNHYVEAKSENVRLETELANAQALLEEWQQRSDAAEQAITELRASRIRHSTNEVHISVYDWQRFERAANPTVSTPAPGVATTRA